MTRPGRYVSWWGRTNKKLEIFAFLPNSTPFLFFGLENLNFFEKNWYFGSISGLITVIWTHHREWFAACGRRSCECERVVSGKEAWHGVWMNEPEADNWLNGPKIVESVDKPGLDNGMRWPRINLELLLMRGAVLAQVIQMHHASTIPIYFLFFGLPFTRFPTSWTFSRFFFCINCILRQLLHVSRHHPKVDKCQLLM